MSQDHRHSPVPGASRREFLGALAGVLALRGETLALQAPGPAGIPVRSLGRTGVSVSIVGYGGWHAAVGGDEAECIARLREAIDLGITFLDNAWEYHQGGSEEVVGKALAAPGWRDRVFLMTKVCARDYAGAQRHIDDSLRRLKTDRVDLLQLHAIQYADDIERITDPERGALRALLEARKAGKTRFLGFSGHRDPQTHLRMIAAHPWDTVQMPLNLLDAQYRSFERNVLPVCREKGIGALGMKSLGGGGTEGAVPRETGMDWELCRRYALSLPVSTVICAMKSREELHGMVRIARGFEPLDAAEVERLLGKTRTVAADGRVEAYKDPSKGYGCSYQDAVLKNA
ncbi:MAG: aldo/keto reductase [Acidobacteria bacterium]|nr:aldo/keto reductase [Acidobacteriota bacterium]